MPSSGRSATTPPEVARRLEALITAGRAGGHRLDDEPAHPPDQGGWTPPDDLAAERREPARFAGLVRARLDAVRLRRPVRLEPGRRAVVGIAVAVLVVAVIVGWRVLADRPRLDPLGSAVPLPPAAAVPTGGTSAAVSPGGSASRSAGRGGTGGPPASTAARVVVDVVGRVRHPGVVRLPTGSRVADAVRAAGGALPGTDLSGLNQARVLIDGEQIAVAVPGDQSAGPSGPGDASGSGAAPGPGSTPDGRVDLNQATVEQLDALPGVGPVLAQRIVDWRTEHGRFDSVDQLNDVSGIGDAKFADLKDLVSV